MTIDYYMGLPKIVGSLLTIGLVVMLLYMGFCWCIRHSGEEQEEVEDDTPTSHKIWRCIAMVVLWCGSFAICWLDSKQHLEDYSKTETYHKLYSHQTWLYLDAQHEYSAVNKQGGESVIRIICAPYAYFYNDDTKGYYLRWNIGCATHHSRKNGLSPFVDNDSCKMHIPANSKVGMVLEDGSQVVSRTFRPDHYYLFTDGFGRQQHYTTQSHITYTQYDEKAFMQLMSQRLDSIWIDTGAEQMGWSVNHWDAANLEERMRALYDEINYMQQVGFEQYNSHRRLHDNKFFHVLSIISFILLLWLSATGPYKIYNILKPN